MAGVKSIDGVPPALRAVAYTVYNIGGQFFIGLVRTAVAAAYCLKHCYYDGKMKGAISVQEKAGKEALGRMKKENAEESKQLRKENKEKLKQAKEKSVFHAGAQWLGNKVSEGKQAVENTVEETAQTVKNKAEDESLKFIASTLTELSDWNKQGKSWHDEFYRGVSEIFFIGSPYYTYKDNFSKEKVSTWHLDEVLTLLKNEDKIDRNMKSILGKGFYNPII